MVARLTTENFIELARNKFGEKFIYTNTVYRGRRHNVTIACKVHGDFEINAQYFLRSPFGCSRCGNSRVTEEDFIQRANAAHGNQYDYSQIEFVDTNTAVNIICPTHGCFTVTPYEHYGKKVGCSRCFRERKRSTREKFIAASQQRHGDKYDYSLVVYDKRSLPVTIVCPSHGPYQQLPRSHLDGHGCKQCHNSGNRLGVEEFIKQATLVHGDKYDYSRVVYVTSKTKVELVCDKHGPFWITPNGHVSSRGGCARCKESKGESRIRVFLEKHGIGFIQEFKVVPYRYRFDFYIPEYNILIEHHGHQHFKPVALFGGELYFRETIKNDEAKRALAKERGYYLLELVYQQMDNSGIEIALEMALRYKGHVFDESITISKPHGPREVEILH